MHLRHLVTLTLTVCVVLIGIITTNKSAASSIAMTPRNQIVVMDMVVDIMPDSGMFPVGETVVIVVEVENDSFVQGCDLTGYEIILDTETPDTPVFDFVSPSTVVSIDGSATFTLTTASTGMTTLLAPVNALYECDNQTTIELQDYGFSGTFFVWFEVHHLYLPFISRNVQN